VALAEVGDVTVEVGWPHRCEPRGDVRRTSGAAR
jgi:hypothetical protein